MAKEKHVLKIVNRDSFGSSASRKVRREGKIPGVVYGHGAEPKMFLIDVKDWEIIAKQEVQIIQLKSEKESEINVLIKDVQFDYLAGITEHIDFLEVKLDEVITAMVPVHAIGTPIGVSQGGLLDHLLHEIEVSCTPLTLPESIEVDISELELNGSVNIGDLELPEDVTSIGDQEQTVLHVVLPRVEEEPEEEGEEGVEGAEAATEGETAESDNAAGEEGNSE